MSDFAMKQYVCEKYSVGEYVNRKIIPSVHYTGTNRAITMTKPIVCPFHADTKPSFYYHYDEKYKKVFRKNS